MIERRCIGEASLTANRAAKPRVVKQLSRWFDSELRLPQSFAAVNGIIKIQSTRHAQCSHLAFVYLGYTVNEIVDTCIGSTHALRLCRSICGKALLFRNSY